MSWVKLDDGWWTNAKIHRVEPLDRLLWIVSISWASREGTDGHIPAHMLTFLASSAGCPKPDDAAQRLTDARLWDLEPDGWAIHDYLHYQPASTRREELAEAHRQRQSEYEARRRVPKEPVPLTRQNRNPDASSDTPLTLLPSRPVPSRPDDSLRSSSTTPDDDDERISTAHKLVAKHLAATTPGVRNQKAYEREILTRGDRASELRALARTHPTRDPLWLADEHLGRPHPPDPDCPTCKQPRHTNGPCPTLLEESDR